MSVSELDLDDMRRLLRKGLGNLTSTDLSDANATELLNLSLWDLEDTFPFKAKESCYQAALVLDQVEYGISNISALDAIRSVSWIDEDGQRHKLDRMTRDIFDELFNDQSVDDVSGPPKRYLREDTSLYIWPPPSSDEDTMEMELAVKESVASLVSGTGSDTTGLPRNWDEIVIAGAIERGHFFNQDYDLMNKVLNHKLGMIRGKVPTGNKEEADSRYAGLQVIHDRPYEDPD
jgi:hypothetical protein